jgi:carboxyl-terminal processing protease
MTLFSRRLVSVCVFAALAALPLGAATDHPFATSQTLSTETSLLMRLLDEAQYNHGAVHMADFGEVVPDYMEALDNQRLFFLGTDKADFTKKYDAKTLYANLAYLGNVDAAYEIYYVYQKRVHDRINWIFDQLKTNLDLTTNETFAADRSKAQWPSTAADADDLWQKRLKFEVVSEILNKKTPEAAKDEVHKRYDRMLKNMSQTDGSDLAELFLTTVTGLYDPHSNYFSADSYEDFSIQMKLQLVGIGALLQLKDDYCTVKELVAGGPADLGHQLKEGDKIISVSDKPDNSVEIIGMKMRNIVSLIRGAKGTQVHLMIERPGVTGRKEIVITRDVVKLNEARAHGAVFQVPDSTGKIVPIGVITLPEFYGPADDAPSAAEKSSASRDVARLIAQMKEEKIQGMVLDLRNNGGGFLTEAIDLTGLFVPKGPVVQVRDSEGQIRVNDSDNDDVAYDGPLAVLENRFSASASEIVAGALQNYGRAIVIGDTSTHGKGTVQTVVEMKAMMNRLAADSAKTGAAKITIQKFYLPNGSSTQLEGVKADIKLPSIDDFLPIGESSLKHALIWDRIPSSHFDGHALDPKTVDALKQASLERQHTLEEFTYLNRSIDWFKSKEDQKLVSLNLADRQKQKQLDDAFQKEQKAERIKLAQTDYTFKEYRVAPAPPVKPKAAKSDEDDDDADEFDLNDDVPSTPYYVDISLRETLRVVDDAINLGKDRGQPALTLAANMLPSSKKQPQ